jgi:hypothetical protein
METQSPSISGKLLRNYALALLIFAVALGARYVLDLVVPERLPFITFFPAVLVAAYFCGLGPSILVLVLSAVAGAAWTAAPAGASEFASGREPRPSTSIASIRANARRHKGLPTPSRASRRSPPCIRRS